MNGYQGDYYIDHYERVVPKPAGGTVRFTNKTNSLKEKVVIPHFISQRQLQNEKSLELSIPEKSHGT